MCASFAGWDDDRGARGGGGRRMARVDIEAAARLVERQDDRFPDFEAQLNLRRVLDQLLQC